MTRYPPFNRGPMLEYLPCHTAEGARRQAELIRRAWAECGVTAPVEIVTERIKEGSGPREIMHSVRVRLVGGLPGVRKL